MKTLPFLAFAALSPALLASDISDLASGYSNAVQVMNRSTVKIHHATEGQPGVIKDVKEVRAFGGALLLKLSNGDQIVMNSASVVKITE